MKVLVITGGSKGIGLACAQRFHENGYKVVNLSRSRIPLEEAVQLEVDMTDIAWPAAAGEALQSEVAGATEICLVHNAAVLDKDTIENLEAQRLQAVLQLNVIAALQLNQLLLPTMNAGSSIIYVGSTLSEKAVAGTCSYVTSKHAVVGLMRATCQDLAGRGIHTACVCPGFTDTEMLRAHVGEDPAVLESIAGGVTFGRLVQPGEMAETLWFTAQNPVINGSVIHANLGQIEH